MVRTGPRSVAILLFDDVEVLDFCGPFEVFSVAGGGPGRTLFEVTTVAERAGPVRARNGLSVNPDHTLADAPVPDLLVLPGGRGTRREMHNAAILDWVRATAPRAELVLSVCTGALLLARAGQLDGLRATTHHGALDLLQETAPGATVERGLRFVDNGRVVLSAGISAGIDAALHVVGRLHGRDVALATARHMEYAWNEDPAAAPAV